MLLLKEWETDTEVGKKREKENVDGRFFFFASSYLFRSNGLKFTNSPNVENENTLYNADFCISQKILTMEEGLRVDFLSIFEENAGGKFFQARNIGVF